MKTVSTVTAKFSLLSRSPLFVGACAIALSACATQPATSSSSEPSAPTAAAAAPAPAPAAAPAPAPEAAPAPAPVAAAEPAAAPATAVAAVDFDAKVQPFFATYCFNCHGPNRQRGRTRFDTKAGILARVTPGDPDNSRLVHMITATDDDHMPPSSVQNQPSADDIAMIEQWIKEGAKISDSYPADVPAPAPAQ
jgi:hypothetical protein